MLLNPWSGFRGAGIAVRNSNMKFTCAVKEYDDWCDIQFVTKTKRFIFCHMFKWQSCFDSIFIL